MEQVATTSYRAGAESGTRHRRSVCSLDLEQPRDVNGQTWRPPEPGGKPAGCGSSRPIQPPLAISTATLDSNTQPGTGMAAGNIDVDLAEGSNHVVHNLHLRRTHRSRPALKMEITKAGTWILAAMRYEYGGRDHGDVGMIAASGRCRREWLYRVKAGPVLSLDVYICTV
jgi:hypothetical protein